MTGEIDTENPKHVDVLQALGKAGIFDVLNGKVVINIHEGIVQSIVVEERRYQHIKTKKGFNVPV